MAKNRQQLLHRAIKAALTIPATASLFAAPVAGHAAALYWRQAVGGLANWGTSSSWTFATNGVGSGVLNSQTPGASNNTDTATIDRNGGTQSVYNIGAPRTIQSLTLGDTTATPFGGNTLTFMNGALTVTGATTINSAATANSITVNGASTSLTAGGTLSNAGTVSVQNGTLNANGSLSNTGTVAVSGGTLNSAGGLTNSATLNVSGGTLNSSSALNNNSALNVSGGTLSSSNVLTNTGTVTVSSTGTLSSTNTINNNATVNVNGGSLTSSTFSNTNSLSVAGGNFNGTNLTNSGTVSVSSGSLSASTFGNTSSLAISGGSVSATSLNNSGTVSVSNGASVTVGTLAVTGAGALSVSTGNSIVVTGDYTNNFGSGNSFNSSVGLSGGGAIVASNGVKQGLSGDLVGVVTNTTGDATMDFGNVRIGTTNTKNYQVINTGTGGNGPVIRGAIQTGGGNGSITDSRLSGAGVNGGVSGQAGVGSDYGPLAADVSGTTGNKAVTFTASTSGALTGQTVKVVDNFGDTQIVTITGAAYRLANPTQNTASLNLGAIRVGQTPVVGINTGTVSVTNTNSGTDTYQEALKASLGTAGGFDTSGNITQLDVNDTDSSTLNVSLNNSMAGVFNSNIAVNFASTGAGTDNAPDLALTSGNVSVSGKVYAQAVNSNAGSVNFGVVHVGDGIVTRHLTISNVATGALTDNLTASLSGGSAPFAASGNLGANGLSVGASPDTTSLTVTLNAGTAGTYTDSATLTLGSHNSDMADLSLGSQSIALSGQVNYYADARFTTTSPYTLTGGGTSYTLDFGNILLGSGPISADMGVLNFTVGDQTNTDTLTGMFDLSGLGSYFTQIGFTPYALPSGSPFSRLGGQTLGGLFLNLNPTSLGLLTGSILLTNLSSVNASSSTSLAPITLNFRANVYQSSVPEPATLWLFGSAAFGWAARRRLSSKKS